uniref:Interferon regulatory factor like protein n=1 Tax=Phallusia mammillata TaxID=59560 RepID=A0A6F9DEM6_9ASCI|nr:interferon regulatory factor like protein [Phallusia mammillata]
MSNHTEASFDRDYKLPLRPWLIDKVEHNTFVDVKWIDREKQHFKIPWTKMGQPSWKEHWEIFQAWAKHGDKFDEANPYDSKYKTNFRSLMNKSEDFMEVVNKFLTSQQTGNYRFYRVLKPEEVKENRKKRHIAHKQQKKKKLKKSSVTEQVQDQPSTSSQGCQEIQQSFNDNSDSDLSSTLDGDILSNASLAKSALMINSAKAFSTNKVPMSTEGERSSELHDNPSQSKKFLNFLVQEYSITRTEMFLFDITIKYDGVEQLWPDKNYCARLDCSEGLRIFQGDEHWQKVVIALNDLNEYFSYPTYRMPSYKSNEELTSTILKRTDQGFIIKCDEQANLWVTRLSQSVLFYYDLEKSNEPIRLDRQNPVQLICWVKLAKDVLQRHHEGKRRPSCEFRLYIGSKPRSPEQQCPVMVNITPVAAQKLSEAVFKSDDNSMLVLSLPNEFDKLLRID